MSLKERISEDLKKAMRHRNRRELDALRAIKTMILLAESEKGKEGALDTHSEIKLLTRAAKQRREAAAIFKRENRQELLSKEMEELEVISRYLPPALSEGALYAELEKIVADLGASGPADLGRVMGRATHALAGRATGRDIAAAAKKILSP